MIPAAFDAYREIWLVDFEFRQPEGERPEPICMVARELRTGALVRRWRDRLVELPFSLDAEALYVAYYASAEIGCHLALDWPVPARLLDLYAEFRCSSAGRPAPCGFGLLGAMEAHGLRGIEAQEKDAMRDLALRGGPYSGPERRALLDYCQSDVDSLAALLVRMATELDLPRALIRGRYMVAAALMEWTGVPIDVCTWSALRGRWDVVKEELILEVDREYGVYEGTSFRHALFAAYLERGGISWPRLDSGQLALDDGTFKERGRAHPCLQPLRELRRSLGEMRLAKLAVGSDGRNRCLLSAFGTKTGRNAPPSSRFVFGLPAWARGLIRPEPGRALAYVDYSQQEFGIAAARSGDAAMMLSYASGDPYLAFARQAGAVPLEATKRSHPHVREQFKVCALAVQYGMGESALARALDQPGSKARELLRLHRQTYPRFWEWVENVVNHALLGCELQSAFGWRLCASRDPNPRTFANFPMQANGADMLRMACSLATEDGVQVCAPVHDALLVEGSDDEIEMVVDATRLAMRQASELVLPEFPLRTDEKVVRWPARYLDSRGRSMWEMISRILEGLGHGGTPTCPMPSHVSIS